MSVKDEKQVKKELDLHAEEYGRIANEFIDTAEKLHETWNDEAGESMYRRACELAEEMKDNYERLKRCCGS